MGLQKACEKLGIPYGTLSGWRKTISRSKPTREVTKENFILLEEEKRKLEQEVRELRKANTTLKDAMFFSQSKKEVTKVAIFNFIDKYSVNNKMSIYNLCKILGVYERTFYKHKKKVTKQSNPYVILSKMYEVLEERKENKNYGVARMRVALKQDKDIDVSISTIRRAMRLAGLIHKSRRLPNGLTKADINAEKTQNLIKRNFKADKPNRKWLTDITEIACKVGTKLYLCVVFDCYNGEIIGLAMADNMEANLCCNAIKDAFKKTKAGSGVIIHSDAGSQYTSNAYKSTLSELNHVKSYRNKSCVSCKNLTQK